MYTKRTLHEFFKAACKDIKSANKGQPWKVKICREWELFFRRTDWGISLTMRISYSDGNLRHQTYDIAL